MKYKIGEVKLCRASLRNKMKPGVIFVVKGAFCNKNGNGNAQAFHVESAEFASMLRAIACDQERSVKFSTLVYFM